MNTLIQNIEDLLKKHNYVAIPTFGGFVGNKASAYIKDGVLYPPYKAIGFNPELTFNDGLLAQYYIEKNNISYNQAIEQISLATNNLRAYLKTNSICKFGNIGTFRMFDTHISFEPNNNNNFINNNFGLSSLYFPEIQTENNIVKLTPKVQKAEVKTETVNNKTIKFKRFNYAVACAIAILIMFITPAQVNDGQFDNQATFFQPELFETPAPELAEEETIKCTPFHIVIGSLKNQALAHKFLNELPTELKAESEILYSDNRFRIITNSYETEEECEKQLEIFVQKNKQFKDAWVLMYNP